MKMFLTLLAVLLLASCQISEADTICKNSKNKGCRCETDNFIIDISKSFDYPLNASNADKYVYTFSCSPSSCGDGDSTSAVCQYDPKQGAYTNCGKSGDSGQVQWTINNQNSFVIEYLEGTPTDKNRARKATVYFTVLNDSSTPDFTFSQEDGSDAKVDNYVFTSNIPKTSAINGGVAAGVVGIVLIVLVLVAIAAYFIIGAIVMYTAKGARGAEIIPNLEFWKSLPGLLKDGCCLTIAPCKYLYERNSSGGTYKSL